MMKAAPAPSLKMTQPQFLLQLFVVALDDPTLLGQADQVVDFRSNRQGRQPVLGGLGFALRPFDEQPFFRTRLGAPLVPMRRTDTEQSKSRTERMFRAFSPGDVFPGRLRQGPRQHQDRHGLMIRVPAQALGRLSSSTLRFGTAPFPGFQTVVEELTPRT